MAQRQSRALHKETRASPFRRRELRRRQSAREESQGSGDHSSDDVSHHKTSTLKLKLMQRFCSYGRDLKRQMAPSFDIESVGEPFAIFEFRYRSHGQYLDSVETIAWGTLSANSCNSCTPVNGHPPKKPFPDSP